MNTHSWIIEPQLDYKLNIGKGIFTTLIGGTFLENNSSFQQMIATGFISDALLEDIQAASSVTPTSSAAQYNYQAIFTRLNYNWQDKYLLNVTARRDGSSRFGPDKQFGNFGAIGAAWIFSKEDFFHNSVPWLSFGKLRASYGTTGNDQIGDYQYLDLYTTTTYPYNNTQGIYPANLFNPQLAWEIDKKLEGGLELGFLNERILLQASYYRNQSGNQLVQTPVSSVTGFFSTPANLPAVVQNSGGEFILTTVNIKSKNFSWSTTINLTIPRNKLVSFPGLASSPYAGTFIEGQSISILHVYHLIGVNDTTGIFQYASAKGVSTSNPNPSTDRNTIIDMTPKYYGGMQNSFVYKGFSLDFFFQFSKRIGENILYGYNQMPGTMVNQPVDVLDRWQQPGDKAPYQQYSQNFSSKVYKARNPFNQKQSDAQFGDASFIRLKNLAISWQFPEPLKHKLHLENCRVFFQGQNLFIVTKYFGIDPESQGTGLPPLRVLTGGIQIGF